jgi:hypothetical protein
VRGKPTNVRTRKSTLQGADRGTAKKEKAIRLRGEGHSLRGIADKLLVDQKQVQRWLKDIPPPATVTGRDGVRYPASRVSAPEVDKNSADYQEREKIIRTEWFELWAITDALGKVIRACEGSQEALMNAANAGLDADELMTAAKAAWVERLGEPKAVEGLPIYTSFSGLTPDHKLERALANLAQRLSPQAVLWLRDHLANLVEQAERRVSAADCVPEGADSN